MSQETPAEPRFYELAALLEAYADAGFVFSDTTETPGPGLASYLRITARDPARAALALRQIDDLLSVGLFSDEIADDVEDLPHIRPPMGRSVEECLRVTRDHLLRLLDDPTRITPMKPQTDWEWSERFPQVYRLLAGYFHRDVWEFHGNYDAALAEYVGEARPDDLRQAAREIDELLTMAVSAEELSSATAALGLYHGPPEGVPLRQWLELVRRGITPDDGSYAQ